MEILVSFNKKKIQWSTWLQEKLELDLQYFVSGFEVRVVVPDTGSIW